MGDRKPSTTPAGAAPHGNHPSRLWTRGFTVATLTNFLISSVFHLLVTTIALYAIERFAASDAAAGLAVGSFVIGALVARFLTGPAIDNIGRRPLLLTALTLYCIASLAYLIADSLWMLILVRGTQGLAFGAANTILAASVIVLIPQGRLSEGTGWFGTSTTLATAIGPLIAIQLANTLDYNAVFIAAGIFSGTALLIGLFIQFPQPRQTPIHRSSRRSFPTMIATKAIPVSVVMLFAGIAFSGVTAFLNAYTQDQSLPSSATAIFFVVYAGILFSTRFFIGPLQDRFGNNAVITPLLLCLTCGLIVLGSLPSIPGYIAAATLCAFGFGALMTSLQAIAIGSVSTNNVGIATSTFFIFVDCGVGAGPILLGTMLPLTGFSGMFLALSGVAAGTLLLYWLVQGRRQTQRLKAINTVDRPKITTTIGNND